MIVNTHSIHITHLHINFRMDSPSKNILIPYRWLCLLIWRFFRFLLFLATGAKIIRKSYDPIFLVASCVAQNWTTVISIPITCVTHGRKNEGFLRLFFVCVLFSGGQSHSCILACELLWHTVKALHVHDLNC